MLVVCTIPLLVIVIIAVVTPQIVPPMIIAIGLAYDVFFSWDLAVWGQPGFASLRSIFTAFPLQLFTFPNF